MKKMTIIFLNCIFMAGCASNVNLDINSSNIGVLTPTNIKNEICHFYIGPTIFNNAVNNYKVNRNVEDIYRASVKKGIEKTGNNFVDLGQVDATKVPLYFKRSSWDFNLSITDEGRNFLARNDRYKDTDYLIVPWVDNRKNCVLDVHTGKLQYNTKKSRITSNFHMHLINSSNFKNENIRDAGDYNSLKKVYIPESLNKLTELDISNYLESFSTEAADDTVHLINGECCQFPM